MKVYRLTIQAYECILSNFFMFWFDLVRFLFNIGDIDMKRKLLVLALLFSFCSFADESINTEVDGFCVLGICFGDVVSSDGVGGGGKQLPPKVDGN